MARSVFVVGGLGIAVAGVLAWNTWLATRRGIGPVQAAVRGDALVAYDESGAVLWSQRFDHPLEQAAYTPGLPAARLIAVADIDGDGPVETLFLAIHPSPHPSKLYCFEADRRIRFALTLDTRHRFGSQTYSGPWRGFRLISDAALLRAGEIWISWIHALEFPSVLERLDSRGNRRGQFWNAGYVQTVVPVVLGGRPLMLVGGTNNEWKSAFLAVVDRTRPSGSNPSLVDRYACADCPAGRPEHYFVFPRGDLDDLYGAPLPFVNRIEPDSDGRTVVCVEHKVGDPGCLYYRFDRKFDLLDTEVSRELDALRRELVSQSRLPSRPAWSWSPVRRWDGTGFAPMQPAGR